MEVEEHWLMSLSSSSRSNKDTNRATNSSITEKKKQKGNEKRQSSDKAKSAEISYSAISLVRRFDMTKTRDQDDSVFEVSDFDS